MEHDEHSVRALLAKKGQSSAEGLPMWKVLRLRPHARGRRAIWTYITEHPGTTKTEICTATGLGWGTVSHHVALLCEGGLVTSIPYRQRTFLFQADIDVQDARRRIAASPPDAAAILDVLNANGPLQICHIMELTGCSRKVVQARLHACEWAGLVVRKGHVRPLYFLSDDA